MFIIAFYWSMVSTLILLGGSHHLHWGNSLAPWKCSHMGLQDLDFQNDLRNEAQKIISEIIKLPTQCLESAWPSNPVGLQLKWCTLDKALTDNKWLKSSWPVPKIRVLPACRGAGLHEWWVLGTEGPTSWGPTANVVPWGGIELVQGPPAAANPQRFGYCICRIIHSDT